MKIRSLLLTLLLVLLAPAALSGQRAERGDSDHDHDRDGPMETLLRHRDHLDLNDRQVERLREIHEDMEERNRPLVRRLLEMRREIRAEFGESRRDLDRDERRRFKRRVKAARPLLREIRKNNREAMREVGDVLTRKQKHELREILEEDRERRRRDDDDERRDRGRGH